MPVTLTRTEVFSEFDPRKLLESALPLIPAGSEYARVVNAVLDFHHAEPEDWRACYRFIYDNFGYNRYPGEVHIIPNAGIIVMALLYGKGDFSRAIQIANMGGWDTDCNVGNVGAIMGVAVGLKGIPWHWREPMNDMFVAASVIGTRNLLDIPACADLFCALGHQAAGEPAPLPKPRYHFEYPGSTHGFVHRNSGKGRIVALTNISPPPQPPPSAALRTSLKGGEFTPSLFEMDLVAGGPSSPNPSLKGGGLAPSPSEGEGWGGGEAPVTNLTGGLQAAICKLNKKGEIRLYVKTAYRPDELSANYYGASFSSKIAPGQTMRARLFLPSDAPDSLLAGFYVWDDNSGQSYQGAGQPLPPGQWSDLSYRIPPLHNAYLTEAGLVFRNLGQPWTGSLTLGYLDWDGPPSYSSNFSLERPEYGAISQWTTLRGYWRLQDGAYHGSGPGINESYSGDIEWQDYTLTVRLVPLLGDYHNINARVQGALRSYALGLAPDHQLILYKNTAEGYWPVANVNFSWRHHHPYTLTLGVAGNRLTAHVDGSLKLEWEDRASAYLNGQISLSNFAACHTRYESVRIELICKNTEHG